MVDGWGVPVMGTGASAEQSYLRAQGGQRRILRARYIKRHRVFSKQLQREKSIHWRKTQDELLQSVHDSQHTFWQKINNIDKGQHRTVPIPMEVKLEDGSISCDRDIVMGRWETTFSNLLNPSPPDGDLISPKVAEVTEYLAQDSGVDTPDRAPELNATISLFEVAQAVGTAHLGKAVLIISHRRLLLLWRKESHNINQLMLLLLTYEKRMIVLTGLFSGIS